MVYRKLSISKRDWSESSADVDVGAAVEPFRLVVLQLVALSQRQLVERRRNQVERRLQEDPSISVVEVGEGFPILKEYVLLRLRSWHHSKGWVYHFY